TSHGHRKPTPPRTWRVSFATPYRDEGAPGVPCEAWLEVAWFGSEIDWPTSADRGRHLTVDGELLALAETLGSSLREASPMPWGDAEATWRLRLADGRDVMARRFAAGLANQAERVAVTMRVAARA